MALIVSQSAPWGTVYDNAYHMIGAVQHQVIDQSIVIGMVAYSDSEQRQKVKAAKVTYDAALKDAQEKEATWRATPDGRRTAPHAIYAAAAAVLEDATNALKILQTLPGPVDQYSISGDDYIECVGSSGDPSRESIYAWLKKQPKYLSARDG